MTRPFRRLGLMAAAILAMTALTTSGALATALIPSPPAGADCQASPNGTICSWTETFATPFPVPYGVSCGTFSVRVNLVGTRNVTAFYGADGALERRIRHSSYEGTLINSVTGASVPHVGHFTIFDDLTAGTSTITGMLSRTVVEGDGLVWRNIGRIELSLANGAVLFEAGEHGTWDVVADSTVSTELCAALA
jgi:hypothetical protein